MFGLQLDEVKTQFFDRVAVTSRLSKAKRRVLSKAGAYTMTHARRSIRSATKSQRKKRAEIEQKLFNARGKYVAKWEAELKAFDRKHVSKPGNPPKNVTGKLRNNIFFSYDDATESVVIGPIDLRTTNNAHRVLEFGGTVGSYTKGRGYRLDNRGNKVMGVSRADEVQQGARVTILPRPYMAPAKYDVENKLAAMFANSL